MMGVSIICKKTGHSMSMGYFAFARLRMKVSELYGGEWYAHYMLLPIMRSDDDFRKFDEYSKELLKEGKVSKSLADFCLQSDCGGSISYKACQRLLSIIGGYYSNEKYGYEGREDCGTFDTFTKLLKECCDNKSKLEWY